MEVPEVTRCFGTFPPKHATYLISIFGLASGLVGLSGIILYGLIENALLVYVIGREERIDDALRKGILLTIGLTSLLLTVSNTLLFLGTTAKSRGALASGVWTIFVMCLVLILEAMAAPLTCFFLKSTCVVKKVSTAVMVLGVIVLTIFLELWLYFMVVAHNHLNEL